MADEKERHQLLTKLRTMAEALTPSFIMVPVLSRRATAQNKEWLAEARRERLRFRAASWKEASERAGSYDDTLLNDFRIARSALRKKSDPSLLMRNILYPVAAMLSDTDLTITDFGGATGELGNEVITAFPTVRYTVVEHPTLVEMIQSKGGQVLFYDKIPDHCSIFYTSGVIQYLENSESILARGFSTARNALILRRTFLADTCIFEVQKSRLFDNGHGEIPDGFDDQEISYPRRTISEHQLFQMASDAGFDCIYSVVEEPKFDDGIYAKEFVFKRRSHR